MKIEKGKEYYGYYVEVEWSSWHVSAELLTDQINLTAGVVLGKWWFNIKLLNLTFLVGRL